ncbi:MAG: response regulator [Actinomycetota bacterium]|nr:response regulator [Actinomycetota bacterium]
MTATVMLVEDDQEVGRFIAHALVDAGYLVTKAVDAVQILPLARSVRPDLILLDLTLPGGGGQALLDRLRSNMVTATTPVVVLADVATVQPAAFYEGAQAVLAKPVSEGLLLDLVAQHSGRPALVAQAPSAVLADHTRLEAVEAVRRLPGQASFDRFTRLAARLLDVPTALVSLVTDDRQVFKSQTGLGEPWATQGEGPLSRSFCQFAVAFREPLVIENARTHPLVAHNLATTSMDVAAYCGFPLITRAGQAIGSLCAVDSQPHQWSEQDVAALRDLADILIEYIELQSRSTP